MAKSVPDGYHSVTPYLSIKGAAAALDFYKRAFNAKELYRIDGPQGSIGHAEIEIGDSRLMLSEEAPEMDCLSPASLGGAGISLLIYVADADRLFAQAVAAGGQVLRPMQDQFYGDRSGTIKDPFGHMWTVATHIEDVPPQELEARAKQAIAAMSDAS